MSGELLVDLDHAAAALSISRRSVQQLIFDGQLRSVKVARRRLVARTDLEAYAQRLIDEATPAPQLAVVKGRSSRTG